MTLKTLFTSCFILLICTMVLGRMLFSKTDQEESKKPPKPVNILLVGDSVDRYMVVDYCNSRRAYLCRSFSEYNGSYSPRNCSSRGSFPASLSSLFRFSKRIFSWGIVTCNDVRDGVTLAFLFNPQGVSPQPPWFWPRKIDGGIKWKNIG